MSQPLTPGGNAALNSNNIVIRVCSGTNIDVAAYRLASNGKVRGDGDMIFYGQTRIDAGRQPGGATGGDRAHRYCLLGGAVVGASRQLDALGRGRRTNPAAMSDRR